MLPNILEIMELMMMNFLSQWTLFIVFSPSFSADYRLDSFVISSSLDPLPEKHHF
jgi:hypothetical protein